MKFNTLITRVKRIKLLKLIKLFKLTQLGARKRPLAPRSSSGHGIPEARKEPAEISEVGKEPARNFGCQKEPLWNLGNQKRAGAARAATTPRKPEKNLLKSQKSEKNRHGLSGARKEPV
jgi:hypothetical protein